MSEAELPQSRQDHGPAAESVQAQLDLCKQMCGNWQLAELHQALQALRSGPLNPEQTLLVELLANFPSVTQNGGSQSQQLQRAAARLELAKAMGSLLAQAWAWEALQILQFRLQLHHAALHSGATAMELLQRCGRPADAANLGCQLCGAMVGAELYAEAITKGRKVLAQRELLLPGAICALLNSSASAHFFLAGNASGAEADAHWSACLSLHEECRQLAQAAGFTSRLAGSMLNLAIVNTTLGRLALGRAWLSQSLALSTTLAMDPVNRELMQGWQALCGLMLDCQGSEEREPDARDPAWQRLQDFAASLREQDGLAQRTRESALAAIVRLGRQQGRFEAALAASQELLQTQHSQRRALAKALADTVDDVMERPRLEQRNEQLSEQGQLLEGSLAQRNAQLSKALDALQSEVQTRQAAEARLQVAHDDLEEQVRQRSETLEKAMQVLMRQKQQLALSRMVVGVAHEMNTPLGNARMAASTIHDSCEHLLLELQTKQLRRGELEAGLEALRAGSQVVDRALERAALLVQRFKALAVSQHSETVVEFDASALLRSCVENWRRDLPCSQFELRLAAPPTARLKAYPRALQEALFQLLDNSLTHGFAGRSRGLINVQLQILGCAQEGQLLISWQDDGRGIAAEHLPHVTEPFFTTQLGQSGTGLGLSSVNSLVCDLMGGQLSIASEAGRGCLVTLALPLRP